MVWVVIALLERAYYGPSYAGDGSDWFAPLPTGGLTCVEDMGEGFTLLQDVVAHNEYLLCTGQEEEELIGW